MILSNNPIFLIIVTTDSAEALAATSVSVRHHWEELFCSNLLLGEPLYQNYEQKKAIESGRVTRNGGGSSLDSISETSPNNPNTGIVGGLLRDKEGKGISKFPSTPCRALQFQYGVVVGVSWGSMSSDKQK